ncbi:MAG: SAM-dependent methyltransferase [Actinomycetia bacterium]|nr:SAM-dependent methyltransferase [Actinomycetes bacterium]
MPTELATARHDVLQRVLDMARFARATAGGALRGERPKWRRVEIRPVELKAGPHLQVVVYDERQAFTNNYAFGVDAERAVEEVLSEPFGHWHVWGTDGELGFRVGKGGRVLVTRSSTGEVRSLAHDRVKNRLVDPAAPFLRELGVTDGEGIVKKSRTDKYHQVEEFVRLLDAAVRDARSAGRLSGERLRVVDLGCGNAYLTFASYQHLTHGLGLVTEIIGVDVKDQARRHNTAAAERLGWSPDVQFVEGTITAADVAGPVDITLALHACDTATDDALARGVGWTSELILAAPCCHHDIQRQLRGAAAPEPYGLVTRHGLLRERWGDVVTDALRAHLLRRAGYRTDLVEFVDSQHTPRNLLLRAHRTGAVASAEQEAEYQRLVGEWNLRPRLGTLLADYR